MTSRERRGVVWKAVSRHGEGSSWSKLWYEYVRRLCWLNLSTWYAQICDCTMILRICKSCPHSHSYPFLCVPSSKESSSFSSSTGVLETLLPLLCTFSRCFRLAISFSALCGDSFDDTDFSFYATWTIPTESGGCTWRLVCIVASWACWDAGVLVAAGKCSWFSVSSSWSEAVCNKALFPEVLLGLYPWFSVAFWAV